MQPHLASAQSFLAALDPSAVGFNLRAFPDRPGDESPRKFPNLHASRIEGVMKIAAAGSLGLFVVINDGGQKDAEITRIRAVFIDLDLKDFKGSQEDCDRALRLAHEGRPDLDIPIPEGWPHASAIVSSGGGGYHVYWFVDDCPVGHFPLIQRALAARFGGDTSCSNASRVMRLPGSVHQKQLPAAVKLRQLRPERRYATRDLLSRLAIDLDAEFEPTAQKATVTSESNDPVLTWLIEHPEHLKAGGRRGADRPVDVTCPNSSSHSLPDSPTSTVYMRHGLNGGTRAFHCSHSHCTGVQLGDFLEHIGYQRNCPEFHSDDGLACRFADWLDGRAIFARGAWHVWTGSHWRQDEGAVKSLLKEFAAELSRETVNEFGVAAGAGDAEAKRRLRTASAILNEQKQTQVLKAAGTILRVHSGELDCYTDSLITPNGTVDLRTGILTPPDPALYSTHCAGVEFDPSALAPRWNAFLGQVFGSDPQLIDYVQRLAGYFLTGSMQEEVMVVGFGHGANGKSVFAEILRFILGDYVCTADPSLLTGQRVGGGPSPEAAQLAGKRLCLLNEARVGDRLDDGAVKKLVSTEKMSARKLYQEPFDFYPSAKLFLRTNHRPAIRDNSEGMWRRLHLLPFEAHFPPEKRDPRLREILESEATGILAWAVRGSVAWYGGGLRPPALVLEATRTYRADSDALGEWLAERTEGGGFTSTHDLRNDYAIFAGIRTPPSVAAFAGWLKERRFDSARGPRGIRGFKVTLKQGDDLA
ncbi:phage/plasmid primase, P4 family [Arenimonas aestuarii]